MNLPYREAAPRVDTLEQDARDLVKRWRAERRLAWAHGVLRLGVTPMLILLYLSWYWLDSVRLPVWLGITCGPVLAIAALRTVPAIVRSSAERTLHGTPTHRATWSKVFLAVLPFAITARILAPTPFACTVATVLGSVACLAPLFVALKRGELTP